MYDITHHKYLRNLIKKKYQSPEKYQLLLTIQN